MTTLAAHPTATGAIHVLFPVVDVIDHASLGAFETTVGWFFLRSPWAGKITEIMGTMTTPGPEGPTVATLKVTTDEPKP